MSLGKVFQKIILLILLLTLAVLPQSTSAQKVRVGYFYFNGYHELDPAGIRKGYGYELLQMMARYADLEYSYVGYAQSWEDMQRMLLDGEIDLVTSAHDTPERREKYAFSLPVGVSSTLLTAATDSADIISGKYHTYNGMRVGLLEGNSRNDAFERFKQEKGFSCTRVYFQGVNELEAALRDKKIDAIVTSSLRRLNNEKVLDSFGFTPFYAIVRKDDTELLKKVNEAIALMNASEGDWQYRLQKRYYKGMTEKGTLHLSSEEKKLIADWKKAGKKLRVISRPVNEPYSHADEDGKMQGIFPRVFERTIKDTGIDIEYVKVRSNDEYWSEIYRENNDIDVVIDVVAEASEVERAGYIETGHFMTLHTSQAMRRDFSGEIKRVGLLKNSVILSLLDEDKIIGRELVLYRSGGELFEALLKGEVDVAYISNYSAREHVLAEGTGQIVYTVLAKPDYSASMAVSRQLEPKMRSLICRAVSQLPGAAVERIIADETKPVSVAVSPVEYFRHHLLLGGILLIIVTALAVWIAHVRKHARLQEQLMEAEEKSIARLQENQALMEKNQELLKENAKKAEAANAAKSSFLFNMSHDIRTPMNAILGFTQLAKKNLDDEERLTDCIDKIDQAGEHLLRLINDVLEMARIENGKVEIDEVPTDILSRGKTMVAMMMTLAKERNIEFTSEEKNLQDTLLYVDGMRVDQVLINIISNAIKYTPAGGKVQFITEQLEQDTPGFAKVRFTVIDNGIGMSKEFVETIFESFARERSSTVSGIQGTGLGMSIVKKLVDMMGGTIEIESELGKGTTVRIEFLLKIADKAAVEENTAATAAADLSGMKVLLVEDNELNREIAKEVLEEMGVVVTEADDGVVAVEKMARAKAGDYDAVLMDIQMPQMDGYRATREIRRLPDKAVANIPIIAMTANAFDEDRKNAFEAGMNDHLAKPIDIAKLKETLSKFL